jgi:integrase
MIPSEITMQAASEAWLNNLETRKQKPAKPATIKVFGSVVRAHVNQFLGSRTVESINNVALRDFVTYLSAKNLAPKTIHEALQVVKSIVASCVDPETGEYLYRRGRDWNHRFIDAPSIENQNQPCATKEEIEAALGAASEFDRAMIALASGSGIRIGELLAVRIAPSDVVSSWNRGTAILDIKTSMFEGREQLPKTRNSKRRIELARPLNDFLKHFAASRTDGFLFGNGLPPSVGMMRDHLDKYLPSRGFHSLRRFRVSVLRKNRCDEDILRAWIGHAPSSQTDEYSKVADDENFRREECSRIGLGFKLP